MTIDSLEKLRQAFPGWAVRNVWLAHGWSSDILDWGATEAEAAAALHRALLAAGLEVCERRYDVAMFVETVRCGRDEWLVWGYDSDDFETARCERKE